MRMRPIAKTWFPTVFAIAVFLLAASHSIEFDLLLLISAFLSVMGILATVFVVRPIHEQSRLKSLVNIKSEKKKKELGSELEQAMHARRYERVGELRNQITEIDNALTILKPKPEMTTNSKEEKKAVKDAEEKLRSLTGDEEESPAVILGASGIYGIVFGLGIIEALIGYTETISKSITDYFNSTASQNLSNSFQVVAQALNEGPSEWSYTLRLVGFLVTILPFIHGAVITFSNKWYRVGNETHYELAFIFFIVLFTHAVLFLFVALNVESISLYLLNIFFVMLLNVIWMPIQTYLVTTRLEKDDFFGNEWTVLNINLLAFIFIFLIAPPDLVFDKESIGNNFWVNIVILFILLLRSISDYAIGWNRLYNRL